ncbi:bifunctional DNA primase/polymerase [Gordonia sp. ABSL1-1]|uniref:bifunctional DNA primase/polymerase n=1 Tax=Gordonia sp. ABSL1-1 TaxID=3053923 RepID=UPI002572FA47|nr:bifunctional DNA primase/polymerase [Gordonia sp. ABSL1-1]MDL9935483.1 bifunctional DNA primase/polymerase [Gordonia sp. ABSL1-1]
MEGLSTSQAALAYAKAGWFVLPVQPGQKHPGSVVGNGWPQQSSRDPEQIAAWWAQNPDYGIALHAGRSGAVVFDLDKASLSELPADMADGLRQGVCQLSRRDDPDRGHYLFLNDSDHGNGAGAFAPFGEVRGRNGVIIVAPTPHAKDGGEYRWRRTGELPALPEALRRCLSAASSKEVPALTDAELQAFLTDPAHNLSKRPGRLTGPRSWFVDQVVSGASVHTSILEALCWAFRESVGGAYPAVDALAALQEDFHNAFGSDARGAGDRQSPAPNEFYNAAAWAAAQVKDADPEQIRQRMDRDDPAKAEVDEDAFWTARPELAQLRNFARSRRVGPWSMFGAVLARAVAVIPPSVVLPDLRGSYGSLNLFVALVAPSGKGKGTSEAASEDAVQTDPEVHSATPGSGEGILKEYAFKRKSEQVDVRNSVLFTVSEIDSLAALKSRSGSTLMPELRKAWMGEQLGFGYAADDKKFAIKRHRYRMTMVVGVQPGRSVTLFEDADGGTPQRFLFFPTTDPDRPKGRRPPNPGSVKLSRWPDGVLVTEGRDTEKTDGDNGETVFSFGMEPLRLAERADPEGFHVLQVAQVIEDAIDAETEADLDGTYGDDLDSHGKMARLKVAAALMWLNGRTDEITEEDWELAGIVKAMSDRTRAQTVGALSEIARRTNEARAKAEAHREVVREENADNGRLERAMNLVRKHVQEAERITRKKSREKLNYSIRELHAEAVSRLEAAGVIHVEQAEKGSEVLVWNTAG